jgi:hypothetical protein
MMLSSSLSTFSKQDLSVLSVPRVLEGARDGLISAVDLAGQVADGIEAKIDGAARVVRRGVPASARYTISLFPTPDKVDNTVVNSIDFITQGGTWFAKFTAAMVTQGMLFGVPAWAQAARSGVAVWGVTAALKEQSNGDRLRPEDSASVSTAPQIAAPSSASQSTPADKSQQVREMAEQAALNLIREVESFYQKRVSNGTAPVLGAWCKLDQPEAQERELRAIQKRLVKRLESIYSGNLSPEQTAVQINKISAILNSGFGTYRSALMGGLGAALGVAWLSGAVRSWGTVAWGYLTGAAGLAMRYSAKALNQAISSGSVFIREQVTSYTDKLKDDIKEAIEERVASIPAVKGLKQQTSAEGAKPSQASSAQQMADPLNSHEIVVGFHDIPQSSSNAPEQSGMIQLSDHLTGVLSGVKGDKQNDAVGATSA